MPASGRSKPQDRALIMRARIRIASKLQRHVEQLHEGVFTDCPFYRALIIQGVIDADGNPKPPL